MDKPIELIIAKILLAIASGFLFGLASNLFIRFAYVIAIPLSILGIVYLLYYTPVGSYMWIVMSSLGGASFITYAISFLIGILSIRKI